MIVRTLAELAAELGGEVVGDGSAVIRGVAGIREALPGDITFLANSRYELHLAETRATAVICSREPRVAAEVIDHAVLMDFKRVSHRALPFTHRCLNRTEQ